LNASRYALDLVRRDMSQGRLALVHWPLEQSGI
jgi:hypothetical protein